MFVIYVSIGIKKVICYRVLAFNYLLLVILVFLSKTIVKYEFIYNLIILFPFQTSCILYKCYFVYYNVFMTRYM